MPEMPLDNDPSLLQPIYYMEMLGSPGVSGVCPESLGAGKNTLLCTEQPESPDDPRFFVSYTVNFSLALVPLL
jgi:hypothetical protein